jgi:FkbM family methyltransferase
MTEQRSNIRAETLYGLAKYVVKPSPGCDLLIRLAAQRLAAEKRHSDLRPLRTQAGHMLTVDISDRYALELLYGIDHEVTELESLLSLLRPGMSVWDIGANFGLYAVSAGHIVAPAGQVVAFEPDRRAFALLERNVRDSGLVGVVECMQEAISFRSGKAKFFASLDSAFSGLSHTGRSPLVEERVVDARTLDDAWRSRGQRPIDVMKIDVEGHEGDVLIGGNETLAGSPNIVVMLEISRKNLNHEKTDCLQAALRQLDDLGFSGRLTGEETEVRTLHHCSELAAELLSVNGTLFVSRRGSERERALDAALAASRALLPRRPSELPADAAAGLDALLAATIEYVAGVEKSKTEAFVDKSKTEALCRRLAKQLESERKSKDEVEALCQRLGKQLERERKSKDEVEALCQRLHKQLERKPRSQE